MQNNINGLNDLLFHQIFCGHGGEKLLKPFLEEVLTAKEFKYLKTLNPVLPLERINEKSKIPDSLVQTDKYIINTECNRFYYRYLNRRNFAYAGSVYNAYVDKGKDYKDMPNIIQLNLNENLPKYFNNQKYQYEVYDKERDEYYIDNLKIITYNIDKIVELYYNKGNHEVREGAPRYARYLIMLKLSGEELDKYCEKGDEFMKEYNKKFKKLTTADFASVFMKFDKEHEIQLIKDSFYDDWFDDGEKKGRAEGETIGIKKGRAEGETIGIKKGREKSKLDIASKMLKKGIDIADIIDITGLSDKKIKQLQL